MAAEFIFLKSLEPVKSRQFSWKGYGYVFKTLGGQGSASFKAFHAVQSHFLDANNGILSTDLILGTVPKRLDPSLENEENSSEVKKIKRWPAVKC